MNLNTHRACVRAEWLSSVTASCQVFVGDAIGITEPNELCERAAVFSERLPEPLSPVERLVLRAVLMELAVRWGTHIHAEVHDHQPERHHCTFRLTASLHCLWDHAYPNVMDCFVKWARGFAEDLAKAHPPSAIQRVEAILRSPTERPQSVAQLAKRVGLTPAQLRRAFRRERRMALPEYVRRVRLLRAVQTLSDEGGKIEPVALSVGYGGRKNFYRVFRGMTGMTPRQFRQLPTAEAQRIIEAIRLALFKDSRRTVRTTNHSLSRMAIPKV